MVRLRERPSWSNGVTGQGMHIGGPLATMPHQPRTESLLIWLNHLTVVWKCRQQEENIHWNFPGIPQGQVPFSPKAKGLGICS